MAYRDIRKAESNQERTVDHLVRNNQSVSEQMSEIVAWLSDLDDQLWKISTAEAPSEPVNYDSQIQNIESTLSFILDRLEQHGTSIDTLVSAEPQTHTVETVVRTEQTPVDMDSVHKRIDATVKAQYRFQEELVELQANVSYKQQAEMLRMQIDDLNNQLHSYNETAKELARSFESMKSTVAIMAIGLGIFAMAFLWSNV